MINAGNTTPTCPRCKQMDAVRKASAVYHDGIATHQYATSQLNNEGQPVIQNRIVVTSLLAKKLSPPSQPPVYRVMKEVSQIFLGILIVIFVVIFACAWFTEMTIVWFILFVASIVFLFRNAVHRHRKSKQLSADWNKAMERWHALYYCYRCDGVFILGQEHWVPVDAMLSLLYR